MEGLTQQMEDIQISSSEDTVHINDDCLKLSRYLYRKDELEIMIIQCILKPEHDHDDNSNNDEHIVNNMVTSSWGGGLDNMTDIQNELVSIENDNVPQFDKQEKNLLFWISEYVESYSFQEVWQFIWKIYFDFYAFHYPELFYIICELKKEVEYLEHIDMDQYYQETHMNHMLKIVLSIVKTMQANPNDPKVFYMRMKLQEYVQESSHDNFRYIHKIYRGRKAEVIRPYSKPIQNMLLSIKNHDVNDILYYLHTLSCEDLDIISQLTNEALDLEDKSLSIPLQIIKNNCHDFDFTHITIHYIVMVLHFIVSKISKNDDDVPPFIRLESADSHLKYMIQYRNIIMPVHDIIPYIWTTFPIHPHCYKFQLLSDQYSISLRQEYMQHLEWHCRQTSIWKYRLKLYTYTIQEHQRGVEFHNIDHLQQYYERYGYEPCRSSDMIIKHMMRELNTMALDDWTEMYLDASFDLKYKFAYSSPNIDSHNTC